MYIYRRVLFILRVCTLGIGYPKICWFIMFEASTIHSAWKIPS